MSKAFFATALVAVSSATEIVYRSDVAVSEYRIDSSEYPMAFRWPHNPRNKNDFRCGATMIAPQVAITAAHCLKRKEKGKLKGNKRLRVKLHGKNYRVKETRPADCWTFTRNSPMSSDIAILILNKPIKDAVKGYHYIDPLNAA